MHEGEKKRRGQNPQLQTTLVSHTFNDCNFHNRTYLPYTTRSVQGFLHVAQTSPIEGFRALGIEAKSGKLLEEYWIGVSQAPIPLT